MKYSNKIKLVFFFLCFLGITNAQTTYDYTGSIWGLPVVTRTVTKFSTTYKTKVISGEYLTILGQSHTEIINPYILIEGIDFLNDVDFPEHIELYNNSYHFGYGGLIYELYIKGYDVIIVDFDNATDYIQNNAMLIVELIKKLYESPTIHVQNNLIVHGFSMGGLVARYALTWMESNNQNHHTRLYVSHDAPHKGANFPLGIQELFEDMRNNTAFVNIIFSLIMMSFEYSMPAARQMLIYHYKNSTNGIALPSDDKISLFTELYNMNPDNNGYPSRPVKIAISNGNYKGHKQSLAIGDNILRCYYTKANPDFCQWSLFKGKQCYPRTDDKISLTARAGFSEDKPLEEFVISSHGVSTIGFSNQKSFIPWGGWSSQTFNSSNYSYDVAPGSISPLFITMLNDAILNNITTNVSCNPNVCFIPTISALDINTDLLNPFNLNDYHCKSSFDFIFANETDNSEHFYLSSNARDFILNHVDANELPQSRLIYDALTLSIPSNTIVNQGDIYNNTILTNIENEGVFEIKNGGSSKLVAGHSIVFNPGINFEIGGSLQAYTMNSLCGIEEYGFLPHYIAPYLKSDVIDVTTSFTYDCSNIQNYPDYNPDSIYVNCFDSTSVAYTTSELDSILNANITIYPNPNIGQFNITFNSELDLDVFIIRIFDSNSILFSEIDPVSSNIIPCDISSLPSGIVTIQFIISKLNYVYSKQIMKL